ncbi:hypothetical protein SAMN02745243_01547 [Hespellia stercorisuis DSM 15480]|uniref:MacB-like periplasmic core domain-containing protein n=2 Tax=Hespellia stercorisuis TaxID=180311 RepID=A0A1M6MNL1_9FIRM|nr:hypothetical protein SAMN02745243_01547 [Hespellia stercorisuis DSM 15480]
MLTGILLCGVILMCYTSLTAGAMLIREQTDCLFFRNESGDWSGKEIVQIQENEEQQEDPQQFTVWGQLDGQQVQNPELARQAEVSALWLLGPGSLVISEPVCLEEKDIRGCLIGENTAQKLFGSSEVTGRAVVFEGRSLIIRDVLHSISDVLVLNASAEEALDGQVLNRMNLKRTAGQNAPWNGDAFLIRNSIDAVQIAYPLARDVVSLEQLLLPFGVLASVSIFLGKRLSQSRNQPIACIVILLLFGTAVVIFVRLFWPVFTVTQKITPGKWSDFAYFTTLWKQEAEAVAQMTAMEKTVIDAKIWKAFCHSQMDTFLILTGILLLRCRMKEEKDTGETNLQK